MYTKAKWSIGPNIFVIAIWKSEEVIYKPKGITVYW